ncbi:MAG: tripartite tricarboxylate transporter substrate binding protein BugD [Rhizobiales bacterium]|nr:tripartite tricarboxylate transporter substrate binding protein BugD [Hyphomicrobiales bacterium]
MKIRKTAATLAVSLIVGMSCSVTTTQADEYPSRTITAIVPYPAGGPSDVVARIVADSMSRVLKQTIVIENVGGAGGTLGTARVATATPDGYMLLAASMGSHVAAPALTPNLRYDSTKDFEPIGLTSNAPVAIVARKDFAAKDLKEFLAQVKAQGDSVKQAHGGIGSSSHMACLLFTAQFGLKPKLIPYRGTGPALNDLIGDHVDFFCEQVVSVAPAVNGKTIKAYVVSGDTRSPALPDVPTAKQAGQAEFQLSIWSAMFAPKGTPKDIVAILAGALDKALDDPALAKRLGELGGTVPAKAERGPAHLGNLLKTDIARLDPILKAAAAESK